MRRRRWVLAGCGLLACAVLVVVGLRSTSGPGGLRGLRARIQHPRVVVVTFDTLNIRYTSLFSDDGAPTPNLEKLAAEGVVFERAYTSVPVTLPAHSALMVGRHPWRLGVLANGDRVPSDAVTLAEIFSDHGYATAAFTSLGVLEPSFALDQGFDEYDAVDSDTLRRWYRTADEVLAPAIEWIGSHADVPFFVWIHLSDPHEPYVPVGSPPDTELRLDGELLGRWTLGRKQTELARVDLPPGTHRLEWGSMVNPGDERSPTPVLELLGDFELQRLAVESFDSGPIVRRLDPTWGVLLRNDGSRPVTVEVSFKGWLEDRSPEWIRDRYRDEVSYVDEHLGKLWEFLNDRNLGEDTLWLLASDHGEGLYDHGLLGHAEFNHEEQLRALWMLSGPGIPRGKRLGSPPVLLVDAYPTLLETVGLKKPHGTDGLSATSCWSDAGCDELRHEWIAYGIGKDRSLRSFSLYRWPWKALWSHRGQPGIFDLSRDPGEMAPIVRLPRNPERLETLLPTLERPLGSLVDRLERSIPPFEAMLGTAGEEHLAPEEREMLESLGYL